MKILIILILAIGIFNTSLIFAAELQVEDQNKLVRILAEIEKPVNLVLELSSNPETLRLENNDGAQTVITANRKSTKTFEFSNVPAGVWKIKLKPKELVVKSIDLISE